MHLQLSHCFGISHRQMRVYGWNLSDVWAALRWCKHSPRCQNQQSSFILYRSRRYSGRVKDNSFCILVLYSVSKLPNSETMWQNFGHTNWAGWVVNLSGREAVALVPLEQRRKRRSNCVFFGIRALDCVNNGFCLKALHSEDILSAQLASMQEKEKRRIIRTDKCICNFPIVSEYLIVRCEFMVGIYRMFGLHSDDVSIRPDAKISSHRSFCIGVGGILVGWKITAFAYSYSIVSANYQTQRQCDKTLGTQTGLGELLICQEEKR